MAILSGLGMFLGPKALKEKSPGKQTFNSYPGPVLSVFDGGGGVGGENDICTKQI